MAQEKQTMFACGFVVGVIFTMLCWRTIEHIYLREILMVQENPAATRTEARPEKSLPLMPAPIPVQNKNASWTEGPQNAPVTLIEYSDFFCPFCGRAAKTIDQLMASYPGKIKRVWKNFPLPMHAGADRWHEAAECAGDQGRFWDFHREIFERQSELSGGRVDPKATAAKLGLNVEKFSACVEERKYQTKVAQDLEEGRKHGIQGTPHFLINGQAISGAYPLDYFKGYVDHALDPSKPLPTPPQPPAPPAPKEVKFEDLKGRPAKGPENAPVTIVEFSDFHCPFCARGASAMNDVMKNFDGKVRLVWRHFPLAMHQGAHETHQASECAHEQGKFWAFHDQLFANQQNLQDKSKLESFAKAADLNIKKWKKCMENPKIKELVDSEIQKGSQSGVTGTPAFFINGKPFVGARPYEQFAQVISEELKKSK